MISHGEIILVNKGKDILVFYEQGTSVRANKEKEKTEKILLNENLTS